MTAQGWKLGIVGTVAVILLVFAAVRVAPYVRGRPESAQARERRALARTIENAVTPTYKPEQLATDVANLHARLLREARAALLELQPDARPSEAAAQEIATVFADFVLLNRTGTLADAGERYRRRGLPLHDFLQHDDAELLGRRWAFATAWARHKPIDPESVRAGLYFQAGVPRRTGFSGAPLSLRRLRSGRSLILDKHQHTAYDIIVPVVVPNLDGKSEHPVDMYVSVVNDGPQGGWDVVATTWNGFPPDKMFILPPP